MGLQPRNKSSVRELSSSGLLQHMMQWIENKRGFWWSADRWGTGEGLHRPLGTLIRQHRLVNTRKSTAGYGRSRTDCTHCTWLINSHKQTQCLLGEGSFFPSGHAVEMWANREGFSFMSLSPCPCQAVPPAQTPRQNKRRKHQKAMTCILARAPPGNVSTGFGPPGAFSTQACWLTLTTAQCP